MKNNKLRMMVLIAMVLSLCSGDTYARVGGGGLGGGRGGGGWSGGGRGGERAGGFRGDRPGEHGSGEYHGGQWNHGDNHRRNNNNDNNGNTTNNYNVEGWDGGWGPGWGYGAADEALAGMAMGTMIGAAASQPSTVVVEQPATVIQQVTPAVSPLGTQVTTLPGVCTAENVNGTMAYQCGSSWYRPFFGSSGVYYQAVPPPPAH
jgi:hypothetical protein